MELDDNSNSALVRFKVDYEHARTLAIGTAIQSETFSVCRHRWRVQFYPRGKTELSGGTYTSIMIELLDPSVTLWVKAKFEAFLIDKNGRTCSTSFRPDVLLFGGRRGWFWDQFILVSLLEQNYLVEGKISLLCAVTVVSDNSIPLLPEDMGKDFSVLLETGIGSDVSFTVDSEVFPAHRAVLAARSSVFRAELFGSMTESTMSNITIEGISAPIFRLMLRYMYSDVVPEDVEPGNANLATRFETLVKLIKAADRYALDRLKLLCARRIWDSVTMDMVPMALVCADKFHCPDLKAKCLEFMAAPQNSRLVFAMKSYIVIGAKCPHLIDELHQKMMVIPPDDETENVQL